MLVAAQKYPYTFSGVEGLLVTVTLNPNASNSETLAAFFVASRFHSKFHWRGDFSKISDLDAVFLHQNLNEGLIDQWIYLLAQCYAALGKELHFVEITTEASEEPVIKVSEPETVFDSLECETQKSLLHMANFLHRVVTRNQLGWMFI